MRENQWDEKDYFWAHLIRHKAAKLCEILIDGFMVDDGPSLHESQENDASGASETAISATF